MVSTDMRRSGIFFLFMASALALLLLAFVHAGMAVRDGMRRIEDNGKIVRALGLTDLCLFTEARYARHLSQADLHSAFQDHPFALEHFPSGSFVLPPSIARNP
jgi:hypothetical protein